MPRTATPPSNSNFAELTARGHALGAESLLDEFRLDPAKGLSEAEASERLAEHGPNELDHVRGRGPMAVLWSQLKNVMTAVLAAATAVSLVVGDMVDAVAILAILALNVILGFVQEYRAEKAHEELRKLIRPHARVRREGEEREVPSSELVPGDIVLLREGDAVPADARVLQSVGLRTREAALTGESMPVEKSPEPVSEGTPLGERTNMVYSGTDVVGGHGEAVVVETGMRTEVGRISTMLAGIRSEPTPLQKRLDRLGRVLALAALAIVALVFAIGAFRGHDFRLMFMTSLSLAVAAVPEGLPGVVTLALALGSNRMLRRKALIRRLAAVEGLGSVTVICFDKTGTLTQNRMAVRALRETSGERIEIGERAPQPPSPLLAAAVLCGDARRDGAEMKGDPMETAILELAARSGVPKEEGERALPRVGEIPFDAKRKRMATIHRVEAAEGPWAAAAIGEGPFVLLVKGAYDALPGVSAQAGKDGRQEPFDEGRARAAHDEMASRGMRVIAVAARSLESYRGTEEPADLEKDLVLLGFVGLEDPIRPEAREAILKCREAGIRPIMITGDHALTALSIAHQAGIQTGEAVEGARLADASDEEVERITASTSVFARAAPSHKLKIVEALQRQGEIVALTGDGVNDGPALKKSDIGVAMGQVGTEVAKGAADIVLIDDNFATIVAAVEEGRTVFDNIRKFVKYLLTSNSAELWVMLVAVALGMPLPLLPLQILWINLVTDGLPALALALEPAERNIMKRPPIPPKQGIFAEGLGLHVIWVGLLMAAISLSFAFTRGDNPEWRTMLFTTLTLSQLAHVLAIRTTRDSFFRVGPWSNTYLLAACVGAVLLQFAVLYWQPLQEVFATSPLSAVQFGICAGLSLAIFAAVEIEKLARRLWAVRPG
jgi:Ca2+-transporting ATPase